MEIYLIAGKEDLLPRAKITPIGKQKSIAKAEIIKVNERPPQAALSTYSSPKLPPEISLIPKNGKTKTKNKIKYFLSFSDTKNVTPTTANNIKKAVKRRKAHLGISLDGDADRIILCDEKGNIIDGDQIIAALALRWKNKKMLKGGVVGTLMSNYGLEKFFKSEKIRFIRSNVGDRYVKEKMKKNNFNLGGEQSGHIILGNFATTGDGLLVALESLFALRKGISASKVFKVYNSVPQKLLNINVKDKKIINSLKCKQAIKLANNLIKNKGRLLVRPSGTEPKIRIMCESFNNSLIDKCIKMI